MTFITTLEFGQQLFISAFCLYLVAVICYLLYLRKPRELVGNIGRSMLLAGFIMNTGSLAIRWMVLHRPPLLNMYEYLAATVWAAILVYLVMEIVTKKRIFGAFITPLIAFFAYLTMRLPYQESTIAPALMDGAFRVPHIVSAILAYGAFGIAFMLGIAYLIAVSKEKAPESFWAQRLPGAQAIDFTIYRVIAFGFLMQTIVLVGGALWAAGAWGRPWGWDAKETWALITWLIYAAYLHTRTTMGWRGIRSVGVALFGFPVTIFTLWGVNYLFSSLHSYAGK